MVARDLRTLPQPPPCLLLPRPPHHDPLERDLRAQLVVLPIVREPSVTNLNLAAEKLTVVAAAEPRQREPLDPSLASDTNPGIVQGSLFVSAALPVRPHFDCTDPGG